MRKSDEACIDMPKDCVLQAISLAMAMGSSKDTVVECQSGLCMGKENDCPWPRGAV